ncbi:hypothetical protein HY486_01030 [Candidatus Woesearchaeota archaeon]|nr:hypothetical protein [Candidatus Woesearchaeota archaeon]
MRLKEYEKGLQRPALRECIGYDFNGCRKEFMSRDPGERYCPKCAKERDGKNFRTKGVLEDPEHYSLLKTL